MLISYGTSGSQASHYGTALAVANEAFVVVATTHNRDNYLDQGYPGNEKRLDGPAPSVRVALTHMLNTWAQHDHLDPARNRDVRILVRRIYDPVTSWGCFGRRPYATVVRQAPIPRRNAFSYNKEKEMETSSAHHPGTCLGA